MPTKAFVLIETSVGKTSDVVIAISKVKGIRSVDAVTGPYDVIAVVEAADLNTVGDLVTSKVHTIPGIARTVTCLSVNTSK
ncbi:MAG: Lrp/AsnC family transcriptional regulator [Dehalococcoidia bacterium]|nr:Lrp/AsnC family transcriptional regulator [Dehalococcoidia bacterium]